jgi:aspartyl aminopeptidase
MSASRFLDFVNASPSPFHVVEEASKALLAKGFTLLKETDQWNLKPEGKYFFTRNRSTIVAFVVGGAYKAGNGFNIIAAHTDSPNLRLKPHSASQSKGYLTVALEPYGGGLWHTWFDRDLTIAGRVIVGNNDKYEQRLVHVQRPILRIPSLAIHLDRSVSEGFKFNNQSHLGFAVLATEVKKQLDDVKGGNHHSMLLKLLSDELNVPVSQLLDFELMLCDSQKGVIGGITNEFIFSPRLDNQMMSFCALTSLLDTSDAPDLKDETRCRVVALFDHEEVGSESTQGAASTVMMSTVERIVSAFSTVPDLGAVALRKSFLISADMAHAVHPNYSEKHDPDHQPAMHKGTVIKNNSNQRYATNAVTGFLLRQLAGKNAIPVQEFIVRNDGPCGTTIGPILAAKCGMRTIDVGIAQLSMHSIREMCGVDDVDHTIKLFRAFFSQFTKLDESLIVD